MKKIKFGKLKRFMSAFLAAGLLSTSLSVSAVNVTINGKPADSSTVKNTTTNNDTVNNDSEVNSESWNGTHAGMVPGYTPAKTELSSASVGLGTEGSGNNVTRTDIVPFVNDFNLDGQIVVVIDPGHGGKNTGSGKDGVPEKEFTLKVAHAMYDELMQYDNVTVYLTHDDLDVDYSLDDRADFAHEKNADLLVSLHFNGTDAHIMYGTDVWIPITQKVNMPSYQVGVLIEENLAELGILVRGIKNFWRNNQEYYGIIRHCTDYNIPSCIVEHCHFDHENDIQFLDTDEKLDALGRADATAVAQYFGLSSTKKDITYSGGRAIPVDSSQIYGAADETKPEECKIEPNSLDKTTGEATIKITAYDNESAMLYYAVSKDGGSNFEPLKTWPGADTIDRTSPRTIVVNIGKINANTAIVVRAYNYFEQKATSKQITFAKYFSDSAALTELNNNSAPVDPEEVIKYGVSRAKYHITAEPLTVEIPETEVIEPEVPEPEKSGSVLKNVLIVIGIIVGLGILLFAFLLMAEIQRRKRIKRKKAIERRNADRRYNRR